MRVVVAVEIPDEKLRAEWEACRAEGETTQTWEEWVAEQAPSILNDLSGWTSWAKATLVSVTPPLSLIHEAALVEKLVSFAVAGHGPSLVCEIPGCPWVWELPVEWQARPETVAEGQRLWRIHAHAEHGMERGIVEDSGGIVEDSCATELRIGEGS